MEGRGLVELEAQAGLGRRPRQHLQRHLDDQAQGAQAAGHRPGHVVAGHVLHHLAAETQQIATAVDHPQTEHEIPHAAHRCPPRARQASRHAAAHRAARGETRRLEGQHLPLPGQQRLEFGKRRAGAHRHHQLGGFIIDDAAAGPGVERLARRGPAIEGLGVAPADGDAAAGCGGGCDMRHRSTRRWR